MFTPLRVCVWGLIHPQIPRGSQDPQLETQVIARSADRTRLPRDRTGRQVQRKFVQAVIELTSPRASADPECATSKQPRMHCHRPSPEKRSVHDSSAWGQPGDVAITVRSSSHSPARVSCRGTWRGSGKCPGRHHRSLVIQLPHPARCNRLLPRNFAGAGMPSSRMPPADSVGDFIVEDEEEGGGESDSEGSPDPIPAALQRLRDKLGCGF